MVCETKRLRDYAKVLSRRCRETDLSCQIRKSDATSMHETSDELTNRRSA